MINLNNAKKSGFTMIELIVAMVIAAIVVTIAYRFLGDTFKGFYLQKTRTEKAQNLLLTRKVMESAFNRIHSIKDCNINQITFFESSSDTLHAVTFRNNCLLYDTVMIARDIGSIDFELKANKQNGKILFWNCFLKNKDWIGGAILIRSVGE